VGTDFSTLYNHEILKIVFFSCK